MSNKLIDIVNISKAFDENVVLDELNLYIRENEFLTLLGPSGCGKTTLLRILGGFETPDSGKIIFDGQDITNLAPNKRQLNTVFQKYALFTHMTIAENIAFGLKIKGKSQNYINDKIRYALKLVNLEGFENRTPASLSGGQQQRIAIARAIVNEPKVLLLDEPLGALDLKLRQDMQYELIRLKNELGITFIFVTHDQEEALALSDKVVVMADGKIQQAGKPEDIYKVPENAFVADFIGESNIFDAKMVGDCRLSIHGVEFGCKENFPLGDHVEAVIRPESVILCPAGEGKIQGKVHSSVFKGTFHEIVIYSGKSEIVAQNEEAIEAGTEVGIDIKPQGIHVMPYNQNINHYEGLMDAGGHVLFVDGSRKPDLTKLFSGKVPENTEGIHVMASFLPADANLSDDPAEGFVEGNIISIIYKGDHYKYKIRSKNDVDYYVDDEWLWNMGDYVSVVVPDEKITYEVINKGARDD